MLWGLNPVAAQPASGVAEDRLRGQIHSGLLLPGEKLPAERKLADDFSISRVTLRDALRVLESEGFIRVLRGAQGGAFVVGDADLRALADTALSRDIAGAMRLQEFRSLVEPSAARLAASRREIPDMKRLDQALDRLSVATSAASLKQAETLIRLALGEAGHNSHIFRAVRDGLSEQFTPFAAGDLWAARDESLTLFGDVRDAIAERGDVRAEAAMRQIGERDWARLRSLARPAA
jgi:GntR family transcriptional regulator, transcriptional repressor for pyruvate dehydrogenase complex